MLSKKETSIKFLKENIFIFKCPICNNNLSIDKDSLTCSKHTFNINKKGNICLVNTSNLKPSKIYNENFFLNRRTFINKNYYTPLYKSITSIINNYFNNKEITILDIGCGEGTHSIKITNNLKNVKLIGIDYSKIAINLATDYLNTKNLFLTSDINNLPFKDKTFDCIIDILSPFNELEIKRVLKNNGIFIKVIPNNTYLKELREPIGLTYKDNNTSFINKFSLLNKIDSNNTVSILKEDINLLKNMMPIDNKYKEKEIITNTISLDLKVYILKK